MVAAAASPSAHVNVFVGSQQTGNTFPGATLPHGLVQLTPAAVPDPAAAHGVWSYNSGYHRLASRDGLHVLGIAHTALSGVGLNDGGDFIVMPCGPPHDCAKPAWLPHEFETASPGYYAARLAMGSQSDGEEAVSRVDVEAAAGLRGGLLRARFVGAAATRPRLRVRLATPLDRFAGGNVSRAGVGELSGWRASEPTHHCATAHTTYWHARFHPPFSSLTPVGESDWEVGWDAPLPGGILRARFFLSHTSESGAALNAASELTVRPFDLDAARTAATAAWDDVLGRVAVDAPAVDRTTFYTALYHTLLGPTLLADADGASPRATPTPSSRREVVRGAAHVHYSTFSLWDTYRAQAPLLALLEPERSLDFARSLMAGADASPTGALPRWPLFGVETGCMSGYPAAVVLSDLARKGHLERDDALRALRAAVGTAKREPFVSQRRAIPADQWFSVSRGLEAAVADSCISRLAAHLSAECGDELAELAAEYAARSKLYRAYYDPEQQLLVPRRRASGEALRVAPNRYDRAGVPGRPPAYEEGTPLQYSFMAPHDAPGLRTLVGGPAALSARLDLLFDGAAPEVDGQQDLETGNIGSHCQGNEPGHHAPYLYNVAGRHDRTQRVLSRLHALYTDQPDGLPGNDDTGQTSAWFVFTSLGLYPLDPCGGTYELGRPFVAAANLSLPGGAILRVRTKGRMHADAVAQVDWQGDDGLRTPLNGTTISHAQLVRGGRLTFSFGDSRRIRPERTPAAAVTIAVASSSSATLASSSVATAAAAAAAKIAAVASAPVHSLSAAPSAPLPAPRSRGHQYCMFGLPLSATVLVALLMARKSLVYRMTRRRARAALFLLIAVAAVRCRTQSISLLRILVPTARCGVAQALAMWCISHTAADFRTNNMPRRKLATTPSPRGGHGSARSTTWPFGTARAGHRKPLFEVQTPRTATDTTVKQSNERGGPASARRGAFSTAAPAQRQPSTPRVQRRARSVVAQLIQARGFECPIDAEISHFSVPDIFYSSVDAAQRAYGSLSKEVGMPDGEARNRQLAAKCMRGGAASSELLEAEIWQRIASTKRELLLAAGCSAGQTLVQYARPFAEARARNQTEPNDCRRADLVVLRLARSLSDADADAHLRGARAMLSDSDGAAAVVVAPTPADGRVGWTEAKLRGRLVAAGLVAVDAVQLHEIARQTSGVTPPARPPPSALAIVARRAPPRMLAGCEDALAQPIAPSAPSVRLAIFTLIRGGIARVDYRGFLARCTALSSAMRTAMPGTAYDDIAFHPGNVPAAMADYLMSEASGLRVVDARAHGAFVLPRAAERARAPGLLRKMTGYSFGYRHMCRFFSMQWVRALSRYEFAMRIDDDVLLRGVGDLLGTMRASRAAYGYALWTEEKHTETIETMSPWLWQYARARGALASPCAISATGMYFSNFFLTRVDWWHRDDVQGFLRAVDVTGSIYRHRWGDAPIQTATLNLFAQRADVVQLAVNYSHYSTGNEVVNGREVSFVATTSKANDAEQAMAKTNSLPKAYGDFMKFYRGCVAPCAVVNHFREMEGLPRITSEAAATRALKALVTSATGTDASGLLPFEAATIVQLDVYDSAVPLPDENSVGVHQRLAVGRIVVPNRRIVSGSMIADGMSDEGLLLAARRHYCCVNKTLDSLFA